MSDQDDKKPHLTAEGKIALIAILCASPLFAFFAYLGDPGRGMGASCCACILLFAVMTCWESRKHVWFWITVLMMTGIQMPFVLYVPWSNQHYRGRALLPVAALDYGIVWGCIKLVEKLMKRSDAASTPS